MLQIPDVKILRVYGDRKEEAEFPIPNKRKPLKYSTDDEDQTLDERLKAVSLHHVIRGDECPFAPELRAYELKFAKDRMAGERTSDTEVDAYCKVRLHGGTAFEKLPLLPLAIPYPPSKLFYRGSQICCK